MDKKSSISVSVPEIHDMTYQIKPERDVAVTITPPAVPVDSITLPDGSTISGDNLTKTMPATVTNLAQIKDRIFYFQTEIDQANKLISGWQDSLDGLNAELPDIQAAVDAALVDWKPTPLPPVEMPPVEIPPVEEPPVDLTDNNIKP